MKLCSFLHAGRPGWGVALDDGVADVSASSPWPTLEAALAADAVPALAGYLAGAIRRPYRALRWALPLPGEGTRYFCIGVNYRDHAAEMGRALPAKPTVFLRLGSSLVAHDEPVVAPLASSDFDYEGELAVVIGRGGRRIARERALEHVAGYACFGDHSVRDYQRHTTQFTPGKNFDRSGAFGPWLVTRDEVPELAALRLETRVNGELRQSAPLSDLLFDVPAIIAYLSEFLALRPGDVIATGTPGGVAAARGPEFYLRPGDRVEIAIDGVGTLRNPVMLESAPG
jgi:2-keto-4-pentenoate hydratase/2-oxohepta-3-ene-1,7-dioic acid hydratase in catechol pathway